MARRKRNKDADDDNNAARRLLNPPSKKEADRRAYIRTWLDSIGVPESSIRAEYHTRVGPIDLYLTNRRVIIEVKQSGRLDKGPAQLGTGSKKSETAFEQLDRYVRAERLRERLYLEEDITDSTWLGAVTDCKVWYVWEWSPRPLDYESSPIPIQAWQGQKLNSDNLPRLASLLNRESVGREWATADMSHVFSDTRDSIDEYYQKHRGIGAVKTQRSLWLEQLKGGGNPPNGEEDKIFVLHSLLILISRLISSTDSPREGFVQWVPDHEIEKLRHVIEQYNWSQETGDILRSLYADFVPVNHRRIYGEYYTPDWLAELLCRKVIDDGFIAEQIRRFESGMPVSGVLDPACGSGTFLYHAAKRIMESKPMTASRMGEEKTTALVCKMIRGMDIHPVAVEMAKANMRRLFPRASRTDIVVYQGDALLTPRPESALFGDSGRMLPLTSPKGLHLMLPAWFVLSDDPNLSKFVESACDDQNMPASLGVGVKGYDREQLAGAHNQLRKIVREESDGVWFWYILNQAGPMRLRGTIGRIVSNPPWVSYDKIQEKRRKDEIRMMAENRRLWVGGKNTKFDVASLFVDRCPELYESGNAKSAWVLPQSAMRADTWKGLRDKAGKKMSGSWDLGNLPFSTNSCVMFFGRRTKNKKLMRIGEKIRSSDSWETVSAKTKWTDPDVSFTSKRSEWVDKNGKNMARKGATIIPHCLVWVDSMTANDGMARVITKPARWSPWKDLGTMEGEVPESWIRDCISADNVVSYAIPAVTRCVLPIDGGAWRADRRRFQFWRDAQDQYAANRGSGASTPKTLEANLDFNGKLTSQSNRTGQYVAYNKAGSILYAARIPDNSRIVHDTLYYVRCASKNEALFLAGVLNAPIMRSAFVATRKNGMDFAAHMWSMIPIPRFDRSDPRHRRLAALASKAEKVSARACRTRDTTARLRKAVLGALKQDGVSNQIDDACAEILPDYAVYPDPS